MGDGALRTFAPGSFQIGARFVSGDQRAGRSIITPPTSGSEGVALRLFTITSPRRLNARDVELAQQIVAVDPPAGTFAHCVSLWS